MRKQTPCSCPKCGKEFKGRSGLAAHLRGRAHAGRKRKAKPGRRHAAAAQRGESSDLPPGFGNSFSNASRDIVHVVLQTLCDRGILTVQTYGAIRLDQIDLIAAKLSERAGIC